MEDKLKQQKAKSSDLSDIVLEKETSNVDKTKKVLLFAASMILLFLVALVVMKLFNKTPQHNDNTLVKAGDEIIHSGDESIDQISKKVEDTNNLFQQEPIIDENAETDLKFEEMVRKLKAQDAEEEVNNTEIKSEPVIAKTAESKVKAPAPVVEIHETTHNKNVKPDVFSTRVDQITRAVAKSKEKAVKTTHKNTEAIHEKIGKILSPNVITTPKRPTYTPANTPAKEIIISSKIDQVPSSTAKMATMTGYFIQVGATSNSFPDKRYLKRIKNAGYDYVVHGMTIKGRRIKKILIGPFASKSAAKRKLPEIQSKINPGAYIYRIR